MLYVNISIGYISCLITSVMLVYLLKNKKETWTNSIIGLLSFYIIWTFLLTTEQLFGHVFKYAQIAGYFSRTSGLFGLPLIGFYFLFSFRIDSNRIKKWPIYILYLTFFLALFAPFGIKKYALVNNEYKTFEGPLIWLPAISFIILFSIATVNIIILRLRRIDSIRQKYSLNILIFGLIFAYLGFFIGWLLHHFYQFQFLFALSPLAIILSTWSFSILRNATLYDKMERIIEERTCKLAEANEKLKISQNKLKQMNSRLMKQLIDNNSLTNNTIIITDKIQIIKDFIKQNYDIDFSRKELAKKIGISVGYLSREFKKTTGLQINEFINKTRVLEAAKLLAYSSDKILDIAMNVGFDNLSTFSRHFKQVFKMSPKDYRSNC